MSSTVIAKKSARGLASLRRGIRGAALGVAWLTAGTVVLGWWTLLGWGFLHSMIWAGHFVVSI